MRYPTSRTNITLHKKILAISQTFLIQFFAGNFQLLKLRGVSIRQQCRELEKKGHRCRYNSIYSVQRLQTAYCNTLFLSVLSSYWQLPIIDIALIGREVQAAHERGEEADITRFLM